MFIEMHQRQFRSISQISCDLRANLTCAHDVWGRRRKPRYAQAVTGTGTSTSTGSLVGRRNETLIRALHPHVMWFWSVVRKDHDLKKTKKTKSVLASRYPSFCARVIGVKQKSISINGKPNKMWNTFSLSREASKSECHLNDISSTADNRILGRIGKDDG